MVRIKSPHDIKMIKQAALIWKKIRMVLIENCKPGISLIELDELAGKTAADSGATCSFLGCYGFPKNICISVNDELIHGVPHKYVLMENDLVTFDVGVTYNNYICDSAFTVHVTPADNVEAIKINRAAEKALYDAIAIIKPGIFVGDIEAAIEMSARQSGYEVIKDFAGHGCGVALHEDPTIRNFGLKGSGMKLVSGMTICLEPMLMTDSDRYNIDRRNGWTVRSQNRKLTCHWEHMVLVTENGHEILTQ